MTKTILYSVYSDVVFLPPTHTLRDTHTELTLADQRVLASASVERLNFIETADSAGINTVL